MLALLASYLARECLLSRLAYFGSTQPVAVFEEYIGLATQCSTTMNALCVGFPRFLTSRYADYPTRKPGLGAKLPKDS